MSFLQIKGVTQKFGGLIAVKAVDFSLIEGEILSVIGPNGAGKTTLFNAITGIYEPSEGEILFGGRALHLQFTLKTLLFVTLTGLLTGFLLLISINLQTLWESVIISNYIYQAPFPTRKAVLDFFTFLSSLPFTLKWLPFLGGFCFGFFGAFTVWYQSRRSSDVIAKSGIARTFQNIRLFQDMSVLENVIVGMDTKLCANFWDAALRLPRFRREKRESVATALALLNFVGLQDEALLAASSLSYGHQRRLEIARALASSPKLLLLDEPAAGMNPSESLDLMELIRKIRERGITVMLIEHHMKVVMGISDRIVVLDHGEKIAEGTPQEIRNNQVVIEAYLGVSQ